MFRRESSIEKTYPCERTFLSLEPASGNSSYAVYSLSANTEELGRLLLNDHYVDRNVTLSHQTRFVTDHYDDTNLSTVGTLITFVIDRDNVERQVSSAPNSSQPYEIRRTEKDGKYMDNPSGGDNVRVYIRPDGVEVRRNWEGVALVPKPNRNPTPVSTPAPQGGQTTQRSGRTERDVIRNVFTLGGGVTRIFRSIF